MNEVLSFNEQIILGTLVAITLFNALFFPVPRYCPLPRRRRSLRRK